MTRNPKYRNTGRGNIGPQILIIILIAIVVGLLSSCSRPPEKKYKITYVVHYPTNADTVTMTAYEVGCPWVQSHKGTNSIAYQYQSTWVTTTAPLQLLSCKEVQ